MKLPRLFSSMRSRFSTLHVDLQNSKTFNPQAYKYFNQNLVRPGKERLVGSWLLLSSGCVFFMIGLGGYTRLTKSGLSMTEWKLLSIKYPTNEQEWQEEFELYK